MESEQLTVMQLPRALYLSGPMTGLHNENRARFYDAADRWRSAGFSVVCPPEEDARRGPSVRASTMRRDLALLTRCGGIVLLDGWERSPGALFELHNAMAMELVVLHDRWLNERILNNPGR